MKPDCFWLFAAAGTHAPAAARTYVALRMNRAGIRLIGPVALTHDLHLQSMDPAIAGTTVAVHYHADLENRDNAAYRRAFKAEYGEDAVNDFVSVGGYDGMAAVFQIIKSANGGRITAGSAMTALKGWTHNSPSGPILIDPVTRDIVRNIYIADVVNDNGTLRHRTRHTFVGVKDQCKELKVGRCGE